MQELKISLNVPLYSPIVLFELFDFNEIGSLSVTDFEYLLRCCITSACKLHNLSWDPFSFPSLGLHLSETFKEDKRISFPQVLKYCASDTFIGAFLKLFKIPEIERKFLAQVDSLLASTVESKSNSQVIQYASNLFNTLDPSKYFRTKRFEEYIEWLNDAKEATMSKMTENSENKKTEVSATLQWIYGINMNTSPPIQYFSPKNTESNNLIYTAGSTIIIYNPQTHNQRYYLEHKVAFVIMLAFYKCCSSFCE